MTGADAAIRLLTIATLAGLLFSSGLRLTWDEVRRSLYQVGLGRVLITNFVLVPALILAATRLFGVSNEVAVGMALLGAAPFAPVVPTFARLARGDLALAGALTGLFPFLSAFLTPVVCEISLKFLLKAGPLKFNVLSVLILLVSTITAPLAAGIIVRHYSPRAAALLLKPIQFLSEAIGAVALAFVTVRELPAFRAIDGRALLAMVLASEISFFLGYVLNSASRAGRLTVGLGTANRNIALAILLAIDSFPGSAIVATVVANGLLLILLGLVHVGLWRFLVLKEGRPPHEAIVIAPDS